MSPEALGDLLMARLRAARGWLRRTLLVVSVAILTVAASGCSTLDTMSTGINRPQDPYCDAQYRELSKFDDVFEKAIAAGAVAAGAAAIATGDWRVALATFLVVSFATDYVVTLQQQNEAQRRDIYMKDVNGENQVIDGATLAFDALADCRFAAAKRVKTDLRASRITELNAQQQMAKISELFQWDMKLGRKMQVRIDTRGQQFNNAAALVDEPEPEAPTEAPAPIASASEPMQEIGSPRETYRQSNVRSGPGTSNAKIASLAPRTGVELLGPAEGSPGWSRIRLEDGREGFMSSSLLVKPGMQPRISAEATTLASKEASTEASTETSAAPAGEEPAGSDEPPSTVTAVTQSNQVKRKAFASTIDKANNTAKVAFDLEADEQLGFLGAPEARGNS